MEANFKDFSYTAAASDIGVMSGIPDISTLKRVKVFRYFISAVFRP